MFKNTHSSQLDTKVHCIISPVTLLYYYIGLNNTNGVTFLDAEFQKRLDSYDTRQGLFTDSCEYDCGILGSIKAGDYLIS